MTESRTLNRPLLLETLAYIEAHPENWDQSAWAKLHPNKKTNTWQPDDICGSSFCFAGRALVDSGYVPYLSVWDVEDMEEGDEIEPTEFITLKTAKKLAKEHKKTGKWLPLDDDEIYSPNKKAAELLGISESDADILFYEHTSLEKLRELVAHLIVHENLNYYAG